jgi:hypothetical protein
MSSPTTPSPAALWTGRVLSALPALLLTFSAVMKLSHPPSLDEGFNHLGWPVTTALWLGLVELLCVVLYLLPRTAVLGAILATGYLGGAMAAHARIGEPFIMPLLFGVLAWGGLWLRDPRLRALLPLKGA